MKQSSPADIDLQAEAPIEVPQTDATPITAYDKVETTFAIIKVRFSLSRTGLGIE